MNIAMIILLICIFFMLFGVLKGKTIPERIMSMGCITNYLIVLFCMLSLLEGRESYIDIAYIFALTGYVANLGYSKLRR